MDQPIALLCVFVCLRVFTCVYMCLHVFTCVYHTCVYMCLPYHCDHLGSSDNWHQFWQDAMKHPLDDHSQSWMLARRSSRGSASRELVGLETSP